MSYRVGAEETGGGPGLRDGWGWGRGGGEGSTSLRDLVAKLYLLGVYQTQSNLTLLRGHNSLSYRVRAEEAGGGPGLGGGGGMGMGTDSDSVQM